MANPGCPSLKPENHNGIVVLNKLSIKTCSNSAGLIFGSDKASKKKYIFCVAKPTSEMKQYI